MLATTIATPTTTTTITSDPGILCFHHCNVKVFCFTLPHTCPNCKAELHNSSTCDSSSSSNNNAVGVGSSSSINVIASMKLLPFRLPYPFVRASQYPCAIVLRPTTGDFLNDYNNATDLHIAVTTSTGCIVEFDRNGLQQHRGDNMPEWWQCLLVGDVPEPWYDYWDQILLQICQQNERWTILQYHEDTYNCYTFVLAFLQALAYDKLSEAARSKTSFCEKYIVPRTTTAGKYISLYRKLRDAGIYVHSLQHHKQQRHQHNHHHHHHLLQQHAKTKLRSANVTATGKSNVAAGTIATKTTKSQASIITRSPPKLCTIEE